MSAHKIFYVEAQACELNMHTGQGGECVSGRLSHAARKDHNTMPPPRAPSEWSRADTTSWMQQLSSSSGTQPEHENPVTVPCGCVTCQQRG